MFCIHLSPYSVGSIRHARGCGLNTLMGQVAAEHNSEHSSSIHDASPARAVMNSFVTVHFLINTRLACDVWLN